MKFKLFFFLIPFLVFTLYLIIDFVVYPELERHKDEIKFRDVNNVSDSKHYVVDCKKEYSEKRNFPLEEVAYSKLHYIYPWKLDKKFDKEKTKEILIILNDSSSYEWGEIGTPFFDSHLTFHSKNGQIIVLTELSKEGQTYSTPSLFRMKWGFIKEKKYSELCKKIK